MPTMFVLCKVFLCCRALVSNWCQTGPQTKSGPLHFMWPRELQVHDLNKIYDKLKHLPPPAFLLLGFRFCSLVLIETPCAHYADLC